MKALITMVAATLVALSTGVVGASTARADVAPTSDSISRAFPRMVPADASGEVGYNNATCGAYSPSAPPYITAGTPNFGNWANQWDCFGGAGNADPFYTFYIYASPLEAAAALNSLPAGAAKSIDVNGGKPYVNFTFEDSGPKMVTVFAGDGDRGQILLYTDGIVGTIDQVVNWWRSAPLN
ncbi:MULTISPECIES: hypothetical protein [Nocardia]|uniref:hypothetical protein n=1 Tax=Nocardia TaxID=1817 RepID=UPI000D690AB4|nr:MULTISPECIES: hypothetical protein [Nocardia]